MNNAAIKFYGHWLSLPSCKVGLMLSMSETPYSYHHIDLMTGEQRKPEFLALNRFGQVPVIVHEGNTICQSDVILIYLAVKLGKLDGATPEARLRVREWMAWQSDRLWNITRARSLIKFQNGPKPAIELTQQNSRDALGVLDQHLSDNTFIVGETPTIADVACCAVTALADDAEIDTADWPNVAAWQARMLAQRGCAHPHEIMPQESRP